MNERHEKWTPVSPGTVIPAGQPYRAEYDNGTAMEHPNKYGRTAESNAETFVDSSWKPPLVLPTEPTWGIAVITGHRLPYCNQWQMKHEQGSDWFVETGGITTAASGIVDFIPLTDEQVARIEAAR